jgi:hypothetical protein
MNTTPFDASSGRSRSGTVDLERRQFERTSPDEPNTTAILRDPLENSVYPARVVDQSRGGIRVLLEDGDHPSVGSTVGVDLSGTVRPASVRWVLAKRDHGWRVGLQWLD